MIISLRPDILVFGIRFNWLNPLTSILAIPVFGRLNLIKTKLPATVYNYKFTTKEIGKDIRGMKERKKTTNTSKICRMKNIILNMTLYSEEHTIASFT